MTIINPPALPRFAHGRFSVAGIRIVFCAVLLGLLPGCTKFDVLNGTVTPFGYTRSTDIAYGDLPRQKLDVYQPPNVRPNSKVVVFFYGGDWQAGSKADYRFVAQALAREGFVTVLPDYRLYPSVTFPAFVNDGAMAVRWVHDNITLFGGDSERIYLMGHSAGAHIATLLTLDQHYLNDAGVDPAVIRGTVGISGPYDFIPGFDDRAVFSMKPRDRQPNPAMEPINFARPDAPPMLLLQGLADRVVDPENANRLAARIHQAGSASKGDRIPKARPFRGGPGPGGAIPVDRAGHARCPGVFPEPLRKNRDVIQSRSGHGNFLSFAVMPCEVIPILD